MMNIDEKAILEVLGTIIHPSLGKDIVTLGLVKNLKYDQEALSFDLLFTSVNDPLKGSLKKACEITLKQKFPEIHKVDINIKTAMKPVVPGREENLLLNVRNIIAIASGKGGVGKSTVATNLAIAFVNAGAKVGLIDADIFGPSIPKMLGVEDERPFVTKVEGRDKIVLIERYGIKILSIGFFVSDPCRRVKKKITA